MASTYSDLKIELIGTGEQTGTWGTTTNNNFSVAVGEAITGSADVAFSSADVTVTLTDSNGAQAARNLRLNLTGTSGGARNLILGSGCQIEKLYLINNGLADAVTVKNTSGTGIAVPAGKSMFVYNNATNVVEVITHLNSPTISSPTLTTPALGTPASGNLTSCTADGTNAVGYRNIPAVGAKTTAYTLTAADVGEFVELGSGGSIVVPGSVFAAGDVISIFNNTDAAISCTCSAVTTVYKGGTDADIGSFSVSTRGVATVLFITTTVAVVTGNLS
jgi:hypothetical protein